MRRFPFHGHKISIVRVDMKYTGCKIVFQCQPGCCARPYGVKLEICFPVAVQFERVLADYFEMRELLEIKKEIEERWTSKTSTGA